MAMRGPKFVLPSISPRTKRQKEVWGLLEQGLTRHEIAKLLNLHITTIRSFTTRSHMMRGSNEEPPEWFKEEMRA